MNINEFKQYCYLKKGISEGFPFGDETLVMKVGTKMFACGSITKKPFKMNLKCDPEIIQNLRDSFEDIEPGFHMNKKHWNSIAIGSDVSDEQIREWIVESYDLIVSKPPKKEREKIY